MSKVRYCEICKSQIEAERLEAAADTRLCIQHAKEIEKFGGEFKTQASQERTSKAGSMKINYGASLPRGFAIPSHRETQKRVC